VLQIHLGFAAPFSVMVVMVFCRFRLAFGVLAGYILQLNR